MELNEDQRAVVDMLVSCGFKQADQNDEDRGVSVCFRYLFGPKASSHVIVLPIHFYSHGGWKEGGAKVIGGEDIEQLGHVLAEVMRKLPTLPGRTM